MAVQIRNSQMVDLLTADFIRRNEPAPYLGRVISTYLALPQLRGFWPFSSVDENGDPYDMSMQGRTLTNNNSVTYGADVTGFLPYATFDSASSQSLSRPDEAGLDITGGLTIGAWVKFDNFATGADQCISGKRTDALNQTDASYTLFYTNGGTALAFAITSGTTIRSVTSASFSSTDWTYVVARYVPSTAISITVNDVYSFNLSSIFASINNGNSDFRLGSSGASTRFFAGNIALPFICATDLPGAKVDNLYQQSKVLFGA